VAIPGAIYPPSQQVDYTGNASATTSFTQIVVNNINLTGSAPMQHNCAGIDVPDPVGGSGKPQLLE